MRLFKITYIDSLFPYERYDTAETYTMPDAKEMASVLSTLGCRDFEYHPVDVMPQKDLC